MKEPSVISIFSRCDKSSIMVYLSLSALSSPVIPPSSLFVPFLFPPCSSSLNLTSFLMHPARFSSPPQPFRVPPLPNLHPPFFCFSPTLTSSLAPLPSFLILYPIYPIWFSPPPGSSSEPRRLASLGSLLDDQHWHHLAVERRSSHLNLTVDKHTERVQIPAEFSHWEIEQVRYNTQKKNICEQTTKYIQLFAVLCVFLHPCSWASGQSRTSALRNQRGAFVAAWKTCCTTASTW